MKSHAKNAKKATVNTISRKDLQSGRSIVYNSAKPAQAVKIALKPVKKPATKPIEPEVDNTIEIIDYSEKAIAVIGNTRLIKEELAELKGRFNRFLTVNGQRTAGWIFAKTRTESVEKFLESL